MTSTFNEMLNNTYKQIEEKTVCNNKLIVPLPIIEQSTTNTYWKNVKVILKKINRPPEHFIEHVRKELNTGDWLSQSKSDGIVLIGKFNITQITHIVQSYIKKNVICNICNSSNTIFEKNKDLRILFLACNKCNSKYSIN
jgi:translation initiation factor 2 beta subunit (eIF-2beta)/eIF-5